MIFLVDFENVSIAGVQGIAQLTAQDKVILFMRKTTKIAASVVSEIIASKVQIQFSFVKATTPNALDFKLVATLGRLTVEYPKETFVIVSNDKGFDAAIEYFETKNSCVIRQANLAYVKNMLVSHSFVKN